ncbi:MAG: hypothetical protein FWG67_00520 [Defluviitaleaceae bacterium]|nr:hypothetical protein [Defluviitaleaceae bacterium]
MKKMLLMCLMGMAVVSVLTACASEGATTHGDTTTVTPRAVFELDRVYVDEEEVEPSETHYEGARLTFVGEEAGGNVIITVGDVDVQASINPSRTHPSFEEGYWHHHLYSGPTAAGSPRINFQELIPDLGIDDNPEATDHTQSAYQRGNLHYIVETGEFRLRFTIDGVIHDLIFNEV